MRGFGRGDSELAGRFGHRGGHGLYRRDTGQFGRSRGLGEDGHQLADGGAQVVAVHHHVDHAVVIEIFGALEALGQLFANRLLDDARAGKADQRAGLGQMHVAQHGIGSGDATGRGVGEHHDEGQAGFAQAQHGNGGAGHLHEREDAFLHAGAAGGSKQHEGGLVARRGLEPGDDRLAGSHAERAAHKVEILHGSRHRQAVELAGADEDGVVHAGLGAAFAQAVDILLGVAELQRVLRHRRQRYRVIGFAVEEILQPVRGLDLHVVARVGHHPLVGFEIAVEHHLARLRILDPEVLRPGFLRLEEGADARTDDVIDPVHQP